MRALPAVEKFTECVRQSDRLLFAYVVCKAFVVTGFLAVLWALQSKDVIVQYMGF
jgi:hypothetical protein